MLWLYISSSISYNKYKHYSIILSAVCLLLFSYFLCANNILRKQFLSENVWNYCWCISIKTPFLHVPSVPWIECVVFFLSKWSYLDPGGLGLSWFTYLLQHTVTGLLLLLNNCYRSASHGESLLAKPYSCSLTHIHWKYDHTKIKVCTQHNHNTIELRGSHLL